MSNAAAPMRPGSDVRMAAGRALAGLAGGTRVLTLDGPIPVEFLGPGDRIVTGDAGVQVLRGLRVVRDHAATPVTIRASSLGHARPWRDLVLAPDQLVLLGDWRARALWEVARALVPARRLVDERHVLAGEVRAFRAFELVFDAPHLVHAEDVEIAMTTVTADLAD